MESQTEKDWSFETNVYVTLLREEIEELKEKNAALREALKELIAIAVAFQNEIWEKRRLPSNTQTVIDKARKLIEP